MKKKTELPENSLVPIVSDGAIATPELGDGRLIPVLIIDCAERLDIRDLIHAHEFSPPGDVKVTWGERYFSKWGFRAASTVLLLLEFQRPSRLKALLEFNVEKQGGLVDAILHSHAVYLQPLDSGARVSHGLAKPKIIVEVPDTGFVPKWTEIYSDALVKAFRKHGLPRKESILAKDEHIKRIRELWSKRQK